MNWSYLISEPCVEIKSQQILVKYIIGTLSNYFKQI